MKKCVFTLFLGLFSTILQAQDSQTEYNFLRLPISAHAAALGGDNITIIEDDPSLMFSNPALAASVSDMTVGLSYMNYMKGANYMGASFTKAMSDKATLAGGIQYMNYGKMKEVDENNVQLGEFNASEIAVEAIFSYELAKNLVGGITGKFITSYIGSYNSIAVGVDLGLNWYDPEREWSVSAVAKNLGGQVKAYDDNFGKMPFDLQLGVSKTFAALPVRVSATLVDLTHFNYRFINHLNLGAEVLLSESLWIGGGYNFRRANDMKIGVGDDESSHGAGLSFGGGINLERFKLNLSYGKYHAASSSIMVNLAYVF
ncbi:MAG: type IX secretion system protein PorQ [Prevotella pallens]|uniref:type IX secretion system protein PorQ n=1 Tax=Prevotella pallens TaxID=60133 RepID=UPI001CB5F678|nr:type IX secretion system protein PorQ [Prevotella pallens]MBF1471489.1 type IX secretion system protein PorQ [Prevotella pallens]MBF1480393.1 type IX secretion system protein PorQ [Prevotella pallens]